MSEYRGMIAVENAVISDVHSADQCLGRSCWVHNLSDHPLAHAPVFVVNQSEIYRACAHHGQSEDAFTGLHIDPDYMRWKQGAARWAGWQDRFFHGGCCPARCCEGPEVGDSNEVTPS